MYMFSINWKYKCIILFVAWEVESEVLIRR